MAEDVDHHGEELPTLTTRSSNVRLDNLLEYHNPDFSDRRVVNPTFWRMVRGMIDAGVRHQFRSVSHQQDPFYDTETPGVLAVSWHIAGLIDPMLIVKHLHKPYTFAGRHDIVTGPIIGFWGRHLGVRPLLRQAEIQRGHVDPSTAKSLNSSSLLTVASKLAYGQASLLLPEGHSHQNSHLIRLRTGPLRSALNAAAIANHIGQPKPVIAPIALNFRNPTKWFSDVHVELSAPIEIPDLTDETHGERLMDGWLEPDEATTLALRDLLRDRLAPLTPDAPDWETWRAWLLMAHLRAESKGETLEGWSAEVGAAREVRDTLRGSSFGAWHGPEGKNSEDPATTSEITEKARPLSDLLHERKLDGRTLASHPLNRIGGNLLKTMLLFPLMLLFAPFALLGNGPQWLIGEALSRFNGEALDKRTTYQSLPTSLGVVYIRPFLTLLAAAFLTTEVTNFIHDIHIIPLMALMFVFIWVLSTIGISICRTWLSYFFDSMYGFRVWKLRSGQDWGAIKSEAGEISLMLGALK